MWTAARRCRFTAQATRKLGTPTPLGQTPIVAGNRFDTIQACYLATETLASKSSAVANSPKIKQPRKKKSELLKEKTNKLLGSPSSWTNEEWKTADTSLHAWTRQPKSTSESVHRSFQLLDRMAQEAEKDPNFSLTTKHLNIVLDRWRIGSRYRDVIDRNEMSAPKVLSLIDNYTSRIPSLYVDTKTYSMIMAVHIKQNPSASPKLCTELLHRMKRSSTAPPNAVALTHLMDAHVKSGQSNAASAIQSIFDYMVDSKDPLLVPNEKSLTRVLQAWVMSGSKPDQALPHMERALDYLLSASKGNPKVLPNSVSLNLVLSLCLGRARGDSDSVAPLADALMTLVNEKSQEHPQLAPDSSAFNSIISLWTKTGLQNSPERAEYWLNEMILASEKNPTLVTPPRGSLYTSVIATWGKSDLPEAPLHGEALWKCMVENSTITAGAYYLLLSLWSKSNLAEAPMKAQELLREMITVSGKDSRLRPSCPAFVNVISCWRKSNLPEAPYKAQEILDLLLEEYQKRPDVLEINDAPFNATIHTWAKSGLPEAEVRAESILDRMKKEAERNPTMAPSIVTAWSVIQCIASDSEDAPLKATRLLELMNNGAGNSNQSLRGQLYKEVLRLWGESQHLNAAQNAEEIFRRYLKEPTKNRRLDITMGCYEHVLHTWKKSNLPEASETTESLLNEMEDEAERICKQSSNPRAYAFVAQAWARSGLPHASERAEEVLELMFSKCKVLHDYHPKSSWLTGVIRAFCESRNVQKAEALLQRITSEYSQEWDGIAPTTEMYSAIIDAILESGEPNATDRARGFLEEMIDLYSAGRTTVEPSVRCFGPIMNAYSIEENHTMVEQLWGRLQHLQSSSHQDLDFQPDVAVLTALSRSDAGHVAREDSVLYHLLERARLTRENVPDQAVLHSVLDSLVKSGDSTAGKRAEMILLKMQELYEEGCLAQPTFQTFQKVIDCWADSDMDGAAQRAEEVLQLAEALSEAGDKLLEPSFEGYMSVIEGWSRSHMLGAPERIQGYLRKMQERFDAGDENYLLNERAYTALIKAYANSGRDDAALMAQTVSDETPDQYKCTDFYNALIAAQGGDSNRAEVILQEMHREFLAGNDRIRPNTASFNNVLLSWSRSGSAMAAWRVDGIFQRMTELDRNGELEVKPNGTTFDIVIATISNDWGADAARKVDRYLELLKDYYRSGEPDCMPSVTSYTEAIRAWGSNTDDPRAVLRAKALLDEMHELAREGAESVKPDRSTYSVYVKALLQSSVEGKEELVRDVLSSMKRDHIDLDGVLLSQIQRCSLPVGLMPGSWTVQLDDTVEFPNTMVPSRDGALAAFP